MREYKREIIRVEEIRERRNEEKNRSVRCKVKNVETNKNWSLIIFCIAAVLVILACLGVLAYDIDVREIPKSLLVIWSTLVSYVATWITNGGF